MRLLHVQELRLQEFADEEIPSYAILSHKWERDEVTYQDFLSGHRRDGAGYVKILEFCRYVAADFHCMNPGLEDINFRRHDPRAQKGFDLYLNDWIWVDALEWAWIDTCCIDKSSSAELSEAINSMYHWYAKAKICYVYLSDVENTSDVVTEQTLWAVQSSQWFGRGWTLQELLAPDDVMLLDKNWAELGNRSNLASTISNATGIARRRLDCCSGSDKGTISVAEKFSWAALRSTTRVEDATYCLLGLFRQNMPLLYGERHKAFLRLQLEIIRSSNDESIFVWQSGQKGRTGLIARQPWLFESMYATQSSEFSKINGLSRPPYTVTNQGLQLEVPAELAQRSNFLLPLNCQHYEQGQLKGVYAIPIEQDGASGVWVRSRPRYYPPNVPQDGTIYRLDHYRFHGLFIVPTSWVWSRNDLAETDSQIIYARI